MSIEYINRIGRKYYLHVGETKTGKPGERGPLATLARQYIKHLDQESYLELF